MKIAVIILNYNSSADCQKCVGFLKKQAGVEVDIVVVDNCSCDGECVIVENLCKKQNCTFVAAHTNRGYNAGNNIGLRYAAEKGYAYALVVNPDMEFPQTDYLKKMVAAMQQDEEIAVVGSDIITPEGIHQNPMLRDGDWHGCWGWVTAPFRRKPADAYDFIDGYAANHYCSKVSGCCLLLRMDFVKSLGFFDEHVFLYCEEAILSRQVEQRGKKMFYLAEAQAVHRHIKSEKGNPVKRLKAWRKSRIYFIEHYSGDSFFGKSMAKLSMRMYIGCLILYNKLKNSIS